MDRLIRVAAVVLAAASIGVVFGQDGAKGPGPLAMTTDRELIAEVPDRAAWCKPEITFTVRGKDDKYFKGEKDARGRIGLFTLQKLLGLIRVGLAANCPQARAITFNGFVDDVFVFRGYAEKGGTAGDWALIEMPVILVQAPEPPPPTGQASTAPPLVANVASVAECDKLAAHPDDPQKAKGVKGVRDDDLKAGPALSACEAAVVTEPHTVRLKFQLARALIAYDKPVEGLELLTEAAEQGSGAAVAALGDITLYGLLDDNPDPAEAKELYLQAAKLGFKPAKALATAIEANPKEADTQEAAAEPQYHHPDRMGLLLRGEVLPGQGGGFIQTVVYSTFVIAGIKHQCPERGIPAGVVDQSKLLKVTSERAGAGVAWMGFIALNEGGYARIEQEGMDDGYALALTSGCASAKLLAAEQSIIKTFR